MVAISRKELGSRLKMLDARFELLVDSLQLVVVSRKFRGLRCKELGEDFVYVIQINSDPIGIA